MSEDREDREDQRAERRKAGDAASTEDGRTPSRLALKLGFALCFAVAVGGAGYLVWQQAQVGRAAQQMAERSAGSSAGDGGGAIASTSNTLPANPVDFDALWKKNIESYAWLSMPGAQIEAPIQQSARDDFFYLTHDETGAYSPVGSAFTQLANAQDFSDPVTVIYGHDVDGIFKNLHRYEDKAFFDENPEFTICTPGHILTYTVVSAYKYDDRHILNSFDFSKESVRQAYFSQVADPDSLVRNVRAGVELTADSKIVQLSTCMLNEYHGSSRYLVTGVLTSDQQTS